MLLLKIENKGLLHYSTHTNKNKKTQTKIAQKATGKKYYIIPVPTTCPLITDLRKKEEDRYVPDKDYIYVKTDEVRIYEIAPKKRDTVITLAGIFKDKHALLIPYENTVEVEAEYDYILEKQTKTNNIYANQSTIGETVYCTTDEKYQLYSNNTIRIFNPQHNITQKKINKQRTVFVEKGSKEVVIFTEPHIE